MADDGMLLNFEIGDEPLTTQVKFKGGRWRDRRRAENSVKRAHQQPAPDGANRPTKRQRTEDGASDRHHKVQRTSAPSEPRAPSHAMRTGLISSVLFTSNPTAVTNFDEQPEAQPEPTLPSNAPLSAEAENFLALGLSSRLAHHLASK